MLDQLNVSVFHREVTDHYGQGHDAALRSKIALFLLDGGKSIMEITEHLGGHESRRSRAIQGLIANGDARWAVSPRGKPTLLTLTKKWKRPTP